MTTYQNDIHDTKEARQVQTTISTQKPNFIIWGAMLAAFIAGAWILTYTMNVGWLTETVWDSLLSTGNRFEDSSVLTVAVVRYLLAFSLTWPVTIFVVMVAYRFTHNEK